MQPIASVMFFLFIKCYSLRCSEDLLEAVVGTLEIHGVFVEEISSSVAVGGKRASGEM